jgi:hypothetical protein
MALLIKGECCKSLLLVINRSLRRHPFGSVLSHVYICTTIDQWMNKSFHSHLSVESFALHQRHSRLNTLSARIAFSAISRKGRSRGHRQQRTCSPLRSSKPGALRWRFAKRIRRPRPWLTASWSSMTESSSAIRLQQGRRRITSACTSGDQRWHKSYIEANLLASTLNWWSPHTEAMKRTC